MLPPTVSDESFRLPLVTLAVHGNTSEKKLTRAAEKIRDELSLLDQVDIVEVQGSRKEEISIELSENAMPREDITLLLTKWLKQLENHQSIPLWEVSKVKTELSN